MGFCVFYPNVLTSAANSLSSPEFMHIRVRVVVVVLCLRIVYVLYLIILSEYIVLRMISNILRLPNGVYVQAIANCRLSILRSLVPKILEGLLFISS